jgi:hypothetical protein
VLIRSRSRITYESSSSSNEDWAVPIDFAREALMYDLENENLKGFHPRVKPRSRHGFDMKLRSADSVIRWLYECLQAEKLVGKPGPNAGLMVESGEAWEFEARLPSPRRSRLAAASQRGACFRPSGREALLLQAAVSASVPTPTVCNRSCSRFGAQCVPPFQGFLPCPTPIRPTALSPLLLCSPAFEPSPSSQPNSA